MNTALGPPARLLDLTRLISRVGRGPLTGIDRVELAYLTNLQRLDIPLFLLIRAAPGHVLIDPGGVARLTRRLVDAESWGKPDLIARLFLRQPDMRRRAMSDLRRLAHAWAPTAFLGPLLRRHVPPGTSYLNVGHSNLTTEVFDALASVQGLTRTVLVHDTIPLDHPGLTRPETVRSFERKMRLTASSSDLVICNSAATRAAAQHHFGQFGRVPEMIVAHLGVTTTRPATGGPPAGIDPARPCFVILGTIEPRKNHALLLDIWDRFAMHLPAGKVPQLVIVGSRGWMNREVFHRLDAARHTGSPVLELSGLGDAEVAALMDMATGVLFPSMAEGFGLPAAEAAARGVPLICNDIPVFREILGDYPIYADARDQYLWEKEIAALAARHPDRPASRTPDLRIADWDAHFDIVLARA